MNMCTSTNLTGMNRSVRGGGGGWGGGVTKHTEREGKYDESDHLLERKICRAGRKGERETSD